MKLMGIAAVLLSIMTVGVINNNQRTENSPTQSANEYIYPKIEGHGKVVNLPAAKQQPRDDSRLLIDITKGGEPDAVNPAIEKVCRFVNIYAGAGKKPASVRIAVVLHGDATLASLTPNAYATRFKTDGNPNEQLLRTLTDAGVEFFVCGQSLIGKGAKPEEVGPQVDVAVSALSALANLQADGYAYVPMLK